jgi:hypothetical protein
MEKLQPLDAVTACIFYRAPSTPRKENEPRLISNFKSVLHGTIYA